MFEAQKNIIKSAMDQRRLSVMVKKLLVRLTEREGSSEEKANAAWLTEHEISPEDLLAADHAEIWAEAAQKAHDYFTRVTPPLRGTYPAELGGMGGAYAMLYALVRIHKPETVVETGVSLGCSSHAILSALADNGRGHLYSSDFPYFRVKDAERYIGLVVEEHLKDRWSLYIDGDEQNLPQILEQAGKIDMFHYDSDKSYAGREMATNMIAPALAENALFMMDDIGDNSFFRHFAGAQDRETRARIIRHKGKHIGALFPFAASGI